jgi:DNA-binding transcriptional regulator YiaG
MTDVVVSAVEGVTRTWVDEAKKRRGISKVDPIADTLEYCAGELASRIRAIQSDNRLTVEQFAKLPHINVTPQTVRTWIRTGQLQAQETPKGYKIAADAKRLRRSA